MASSSLTFIFLLAFLLLLRAEARRIPTQLTQVESEGNLRSSMVKEEVCGTRNYAKQIRKSSVVMRETDHESGKLGSRLRDFSADYQVPKPHPPKNN